MKTIPLTKGKISIVDDDDYERLNKHSWRYGGAGYATRTITIYMHKEILGQDGYQTDHANGNKLDNRKSNLRIATRSENTRNKGVRSDNLSGYKGVSFAKREQKWSAQICVHRKNRHLGYFDTPEQAAEAYDREVEKMHGEFGRKNLV